MAATMTAALVAGMVAGEADPAPAESRRRWRWGRRGAGAVSELASEPVSQRPREAPAERKRGRAMSTLAEGRRVAANLRGGISGAAAGTAARGLRRLLDADAVALGGLHGGLVWAGRPADPDSVDGLAETVLRTDARASAGGAVALPVHVRDTLAGVLVVTGSVAPAAAREAALWVGEAL